MSQCYAHLHMPERRASTSSTFRSQHTNIHHPTPLPLPLSLAQHRLPSAQPAAAPCCSSNSNCAFNWQPASQPRSVACNAGFGFGNKSSKSSKNCPCGSGRLYSDCCQRYHKSSSLSPDTAESLIRARYAAFVKKDVKFLRGTSHPDNPALQGSTTAADAEVQRSCTYEEDLAMTFVAAEFIGLEVLGTAGSADGGSASVDYAVTFKRRIDSTGAKVKQPQEEVVRERSSVVKDEDGRWLVLNVTPLPAAESAAGPAGAA